MKKILTTILFFIPFFLLAQDYNCDGNQIEIISGMEIHITIEVNGQIKYLDGKTCSQSLQLRDTTEGFGGTFWEMYIYDNTPSIFRYKSLGACDTNWLDGVTSSGNLTLRDEFYTGSNYTGTRWKIYLLENGNYALESLGFNNSTTRWLCYKDGEVTLLDDYSVYGSNWNFIIL